MERDDGSRLSHRCQMDAAKRNDDKTGTGTGTGLGPKAKQRKRKWRNVHIKSSPLPGTEALANCPTLTTEETL